MANDPFQATLLFSDFISAILLFAGTLFLVSTLKVFAGSRLKSASIMVSFGLLLFSLLHEFGEFMYGAGIHGGFPKTFLGSMHIIFFGAAGSFIFFMGCYLIYKRYSDFLRGD